MNIPLSLGRNALWLGSATIGGMVASFFYIVLVARYLGPYDFGRYSLILGVAGWLVSVGQGGGTTALVVMSAQRPECSESFLKPGLLIQVTVGLVATIASLPIIWVLNPDAGLLLPTILYGVASTAFLALSVPVSIQRGLNRMEWAWTATASQVFTLALFYGVVWLHAGLSAVFASNAIAYTAICLITLQIAFTHRDRRASEPDPRVLRAIAATSCGLWAVTALQWIHWKLGLIVVQIFAGSHDVGIYSAGVRVVESLRTLPWFLLMIVLPSMAHMADGNPRRTQALIRRSLRLLLLVGFPVSSVLVQLSSYLTSKLYTYEFAAAHQVFRLAALGFVAGCVHWVFLNALVAFKAHGALMWTYAVGITSQAMLSVFLMRHVGVQGVAMAAVLGECVVATVAGYYVTRLAGRPFDAATVRLLVAGVSITGVALLWPPTQGVHAFIRAALFCVMHLGAALFVRGIRLSELWALLPRREALLG